MQLFKLLYLYYFFTKMINLKSEKKDFLNLNLKELKYFNIFFHY